MRKKYIGITDEFSIINGKVYEILGLSRGWYRIVDESGEDYLYPPQFFVDENAESFIESKPSEYIRDHLAGDITNVGIID